MGTFDLNRSSRSNRLIIKLGDFGEYLLTDFVGYINLIHRIKEWYSVVIFKSLL